MLAKTPILSVRVLVKIRGFDDYRGDDLRFRPGSSDITARIEELMSSYRSLEGCTVVGSTDEPTHAYRDGQLTRLSDARPPGYRDAVPVRGEQERADGIQFVPAPAGFRDRTAVEAGLFALALLAVASLLFWWMA